MLVLETKIYVPRPPRGLVPRPRLHERLDRGAVSTLLLVSAPAGFGKTTLLAGWLAASPADRAVAWVSLDPADTHPQTFWAYVIAALQTVAPGVGANALALLQAPQAAPALTVLTTLLNDLQVLDRDVVLVLDDYHLIDVPEVHEQVAFLLDHMPRRVHLVLAGRSDPALPLSRLRARGELVEIRASDLRFTAEEAVAYLNGAMALQLTAEDVTALEERTEGWIAALQLAALSLQGRADVAGFIAGFAGDDRYVVDYLVEEVLSQQTDRVQRFLLQTSVLDRLSGSLCDAVTDQDGGKAMLEALDRGNLFLVPLDDRRRWYRYHHLFADVLRARLLDEQPGLVHELHRRASDWYEQRGDRAVAIDHALAAEDFARAADLIELAAPATQRDRQEATLRRWLEALPDAHVRVRPVLSNDLAGTRLVRGELEGVEPRLRDAERWLDATSRDGRPPATTAEMVVVDEARFRALPATVAIHRAGQALLLGDRPSCVAHARRALDLAGADDHLQRAAAAALIGLASWGDGDLVAAHAGYTASRVSMERAGHLADVLGLAITLADLEIVQGRLRQAMRTYEQALSLAATPDGPVLRGTADMHVGRAALHLEHGDLAAATELLERSHALGDHLGLPQHPYRWRIAMARVRQVEGDLAGAVPLLDDAERVYHGDYSPNVRPVPAMRARVWLAQGRLADAFDWVRTQGLSVDDELTYLREYEHVTLARALLARYRIERDLTAGQQAVELLERLLAAAEDGGRTGSVLEVLVLQALAHQARGDLAAAMAPLQRALALAEPEGSVRVFLDEGPPMTALLSVLRQRGTAPAYATVLLTGAGDRPTRPTGAPGLVEPLSDRELDVLRLLAGDLGGPAIAQQLVVSLNTVRTHTKNIYAKLGVNDRRAAVRRATELDLLRTRR